MPRQSELKCRPATKDSSPMCRLSGFRSLLKMIILKIFKSDGPEGDLQRTLGNEPKQIPNIRNETSINGICTSEMGRMFSTSILMLMDVFNPEKSLKI
jgi:hypothetical protein